MMDENKELNDEVNEGANEEVSYETTKLNDEDVAGVSGGDVIWQPWEKGGPWAVIDQKTGNHVGNYRSKKQALQAAKSEGVSDEVVQFWCKQIGDDHDDSLCLEDAYNAFKKNAYKKIIDDDRLTIDEKLSILKSIGMMLNNYDK